MSDEIFSGEGAQPPNERKSNRAFRRVRKLSGPQAAALGELAYKLYEVARLEVPSETKWKMLQAKLLAWRAAYLP